MDIEQFKLDIERKTGVPASFLNGDTEEENIAQAKALLAYKRECEQTQPQTLSEQLKEWIGKPEGLSAQDQSQGNYNSTQKQFAEWFSKSTDPYSKFL